MSDPIDEMVGILRLATDRRPYGPAGMQAPFELGVGFSAGFLSQNQVNWMKSTRTIQEFESRASNYLWLILRHFDRVIAIVRQHFTMKTTTRFTSLELC